VGGAWRLSHSAIKEIYGALKWYHSNRGGGRAGVVLKYFEMWEQYHAIAVNFADIAWGALRELAKKIGVTASGGADDKLFLFSVETYLHFFARALALSKLGRPPQDLGGFISAVTSNRNAFPPSIFEWVFEAASDPGLPARAQLVGSLDAVLAVLYNLNMALTTDVFRELYQDALPGELRKSLGEFYTREEVVDEVLDAAGLGRDALQRLYDRWREGRGRGDVPAILDPACGSGSFLLRVAERAFGAIGCRRDIAQFLEETLVGVDINPFAAEVARVNLIVKLADIAARCGVVYTPGELRIYWGDSLAKASAGVSVMARPRLVVRVPALSQVLGLDTVSVPVIRGLDPLWLVDTAYKHAAAGKGAAAFAQAVVAASADATGREGELEDLYGAVDRLHRAGNERLVELLKSAIKVSALVGSCDYVVGNPPWVRIQKVAEGVREFLRRSYRYFAKGSAYDPRFKRAEPEFREQHDYSVAFVERGLEFLRAGGVLSYVITSKVARAAYAGALREDLVANYKILEVRDYSLYPTPLFKDAVNYPLIIAVKKERPGEDHVVRVTVANTAGQKMCFHIPQRDLPMDRGDRKSPWLLAPPSVVRVYRKIESKCVRLGDIYEIPRGVTTSADAVYIGVAKPHGCQHGVAVLEFRDKKSGRTAQAAVEADLVHPLVRGRGIDPFSYTYREHIVFTHDVDKFEPLWDPDQRAVLEALGVTGRGFRRGARGSAVVYIYEAEKGNQQAASRVAQGVVAGLRALEKRGYEVRPASPCAVQACYEISKGGRKVLDLRVEVGGGRCSVYIEGLRVPGAARATKYLVSPQVLEKLVGRKNLALGSPPWAIFEVSGEKFRDYRIAWQEIAKRFEACILPSKVPSELCGTRAEKLLVPHKTVYFVVEPDKSRAAKLLLYLNTRLARSMLKLWAWNAERGYYRHLTIAAGAIPVPDQQLRHGLWSWVEDRIKGVDGAELNTALKKVYEEEAERLEQELARALDITEEEYRELVEWGEWLNERSPPRRRPQKKAGP